MDSNKPVIFGIVAVILAVLVGGVLWMGSNNDENDTQEDMNTQDRTVEMESNQQDQQQTQDIVGLASGVADLSTLVTAVQAADLVETLQGSGPYTVFAPTNAAFDALPEGTLESLLQEENKQQLTDVLTYHVVATEAMSTDLTDGQTITTVQGQDLTVNIENGAVMIMDASGNTANVVQADVDASNGVVHVIDAVLLPQTN